MLRLLELGPYRNALLLRGLLVWVVVRLAAAWIDIADPGLLLECFIVALVGGVVLLDAVRREEDLFLGNLGVPQWAIALTALPLAMALEWFVP